MLFLLYFGRKRPWKRDILGRAGYICRMRKKLLVLMAGAASIAGPVQAQFNTVSTVPSRYRVEVVSAGRDNVATLPGNMLSVQDSLPSAGDAAPALPADTCKHVWIERYLSVSYPLHRMKINSLYGYRKDPFTGKKKFHNGIDLHARGDEVMAMMAGVVVKVGQDKSSGKYVTLRMETTRSAIATCRVSLPGKGLLSGRGMSSVLPVLQDAAPANTCIFPASSMEKVSIR